MCACSFVCLSVSACTHWYYYSIDVQSKKVAIPSKINAVETLPRFKKNAPATVYV